MTTPHQSAIGQAGRVRRSGPGRGPTRLVRALAVRDHVLRERRRQARPDQKPTNAWSHGSFSVLVMTPFDASPDGRFDTWRDYTKGETRMGTAVLPYRMDVWGRGGKVMSLEWDDGQARLISFRSGAWEREILDPAIDRRA